MTSLTFLSYWISLSLPQFLSSSRQVPDLMENPEVVTIATAHGKSPAQILLRYLLELGVSAIPKSTNANRLKSNMDLFDFKLTEAEKSTLASLDANIRICDFAFFQGVRKHAEWPFGDLWEFSLKFFTSRNSVNRDWIYLKLSWMFSPLNVQLNHQ